MTLRKHARSAAGAATIAALILVAVFGSPPYVEWAQRHADPATGGGYFLRTLAWPAWRFTTRDDVAGAVRDVVAADLRALLVVALTAVLFAAVAGASQSLPSHGRAGLGTLVLAWGGFMLAAALAGLLTAFVGSSAAVRTAFEWAANGAVYGLFTGWLVGVAALLRR